MGRQISTSIRIKALLEKQFYKTHRRISRAVLNGDAFRERKKRDQIERNIIEREDSNIINV